MALQNKKMQGLFAEWMLTFIAFYKNFPHRKVCFLSPHASRAILHDSRGVGRDDKKQPKLSGDFFVAGDE